VVNETTALDDLVVDAPATAAAGPADALEAVAAVDRAVAAGLEGHLGLLAAATAYDVEHLTLDAWRP
jgi:hypothetical protein